MKTPLASLTLTFAIFFGQAAHPEDLLSRLIRPQEDRVIAIFREIAKIYRPSGHEEGVRKFLKQISTEAQSKIWRDRKIEFAEDAVGNVLIRVPGTGRFVVSRAAPVALQAHTDMVLEVRDTNLGRHEQFRNGVQIQETNGWLHSKDFKTTLGADNGIGVALALNYLIDDSLEHPPLELLFTVDEEVGMGGARALNFPLKAATLINLDEEIDTQFCYGCLGGERVMATGYLATVPVSPDATAVKVTIDHLPSGHSGMFIHENRPNAILVGADLIKKLKQRGATFQVLNAQSGSPEALNVIPKTLALSFAVPRRQMQSFQRRLEAVIKLLKSEFPPNVAREATFSLENGRLANTMAVEPQTSLAFFEMLEKIQNGVIVQDRAFPNGAKTSSNLGYLSLEIGEGGASASLGYLLRSFSAEEIESYSRFNQETLKKNWPDSTTPDVQVLGTMAPWLADATSPLYSLAKEVDPKATMELAAGGLETAILARKYPHMQMISLGPNMLDVHTPDERVEIASVKRTADVLQNLLSRLSICEGLL